MNTITIELCQEDRARLDSLIAKLDHIIGPSVTFEGFTDYGYKSHGILYANAEEAAEAEQEETPEPYSEPTPFEAPKPDKPEEPKVALANIRQKYISLSTDGKRDEARNIIKAYAERIGEIPEDKYVEVWKKLTALEG